MGRLERKIDAALTGNKYTDAALTGNKYTDAALTGNKYTDAALTGNKYTDAALTGNKYTDAALTGNKYTDVPGDDIMSLLERFQTELGTAFNDVESVAAHPPLSAAKNCKHDATDGNVLTLLSMLRSATEDKEEKELITTLEDVMSNFTENMVSTDGFNKFINGGKSVPEGCDEISAVTDALAALMKLGPM